VKTCRPARESACAKIFPVESMPSPASPPMAQLRSSGISTFGTEPPRKSLLTSGAARIPDRLRGHDTTGGGIVGDAGDVGPRPRWPWTRASPERQRLCRGTPTPGMDWEAPVVAVREVGPDAVTITFETPEGFSARPGQFVQLSARVAGEEVARFYTVSSPRTTETFETTLTVDPEGELSPHLAGLPQGERVTVSGPFGSAAYDGERAVLALAGGPGVGAALGVAERAVAEGGEAAIVYAAAEPIHGDRLEALRERGVPVTVLAADADVAPAVATAIEGLEDPTTFVYGFAPFVEAARGALEAAGVDPDSGGVRIESFGPPPESDPESESDSGS